ncbi:beta-glucosidase BglX [Roseivirga sp. BDSF3-8]|uniref:beta-glucosidase BglX n=1 Tax=Roseivirga sp. BDSF3-8 TaxID=3241598 RepID=UPI003531F70D
MKRRQGISPSNINGMFRCSTVIRTITFTITLAVLAVVTYSCVDRSESKPRMTENNTRKYAPIVEELLAKMTLEEKAGQLNFYVGDLFNTGPTVRTSESDKFDEKIKNGTMTGLFNVHGAEYTARLQKIAVEESRLGIPLVFGADVIHGFKTVFPIPLGTAASWDMALIEEAERVAARESTAAGITFNFAPMVDIARDSRWGRMAEGAGEDPYLGSEVAKARVRGFQGDDLTDEATMAACVKHFAAYGAAEGGRDYNTVDMSERLLRQTYLVPYKAAVEAGAATVMTSFNELNGEPVTGSKWLIDDILRNEWGFEGMVVSDWQSITEMVAHGNVADNAEAAAMALKAGVDMDMMGDAYLDHIPDMVRNGKIDEAYLDQAVRNVLQLKYDLGLFDDPYKYSKEAREKEEIRSEEHLAVAREAARKSIVLLKNEDKVLPLTGNEKTIAVIGPLADNQSDMNGTWSFFGEAQHPVTFLQGIKERAGEGTNVIFAKGCNLYDNKTDGFAEALQAARKADVVILAVGESAVMNGEAGSRANIGLPGIQQQLVNKVMEAGKPTVAMVMSGRGMAISELHEQVPAIMAVWALGSEAGHGAADVLFGDYNPAGKLPVTFPRHVGQAPIYYNYKHTGRPYEGDYSEPLSERVYKSKYRDVENSPLYAFGHGLSYTTFEYSPVTLSDDVMEGDNTLTASVEVTNTGDHDGEEVIQLYIRDLVGSVTRPVKELKAFRKEMIKKGETKTFTFEISEEDLAFYRHDMSWGAEPGEFKVFIGSASDNVQEASFSLKKSEI